MNFLRHNKFFFFLEIFGYDVINKKHLVCLYTLSLFGYT